jgi:glycogen operon protein
MILCGDEVLRTQCGNNNCYCQDNEMSWFDWGLTETNKEMLHFVTEMIAFRRRHPCLMRRQFLTGRQASLHLPDVSWHGRQLNRPKWDDPGAQVLAYTLAGISDGEEDLHIMLNMSDRALDMELPEVPGRAWYYAVDTSQPSPADIPEAVDQKEVRGRYYGMAPRSIAVLEGR